MILALPRGGVPVAVEVAAALNAPLDLILVRKIGVPFQPELAMGAVVDGGAPIIVRNEDVIEACAYRRIDIQGHLRQRTHGDRTASSTLFGQPSTRGYQRSYCNRDR